MACEAGSPFRDRVGSVNGLACPPIDRHEEVGPLCGPSRQVAAGSLVGAWTRAVAR